MIQICTPDKRCYVVREPNMESYWLLALLTHAYSTKIFHHALFDIRFLKRWLGIDIAGPVECTKTLAKFIYPGEPSGLAKIVRARYGIKLPHISDYNWDGKLSAKQKEYIVGDVLYLNDILKDLKREATHEQLSRYPLAIRTIRNKVILEVEGYEDVLDYSTGNKERIQDIRAIWGKIKLERKIR